MSQADIAKLKRGGYINQSDKTYFTIRVKLTAGNITSDQMAAVSAIAGKYGRGYVGLTTRLGIEIPWVTLENLECVKEELLAVGLAPGGTGPTVRPIVACKGTICVHGLGDTQGLCSDLDKAFFGREVGAKCKIGIVGCPNNCAKAQLNDIGFMGQCVPKVEVGFCAGCSKCVSVCKVKAIEMMDGKVKIDTSKCIRCGKCVKACAVKAITVDKQGFVPYLGGKFGRKHRLGDRYDEVMSQEEAVDFTGRVLEYYVANANKGERLSDFVGRVGVEALIEGLK